MHVGGSASSVEARIQNLEKAVEWRNEAQGAILRDRVVELESAQAELGPRLDRRLDGLQTEVRADVSRRWGSFEESDKRFKSWVQREQEAVSAQLQSVKGSLLESLSQQQRAAVGVAQQCQGLDMKVQNLDAFVAQLAAQQQARADAGAGPQVATSSEDLQGLREDLERESRNRSSLANEVHEKIQDLHGMLAEMKGGNEQEAMRQNQALQEQMQQKQGKLASLGPTVEQVRAEVAALRDQIQRQSADLPRQSEEVEARMMQRVAAVQETALASTKELWEEHRNLVAECKASMASLQQIIEMKDGMQVQLQGAHQKHREEERRELLTNQQMSKAAIEKRLAEIETQEAKQSKDRAEAEKILASRIERMGKAIEEVQSQWLKESERLTAGLRDVQKSSGGAIEVEVRQMDRKLEENTEDLRRRLEELSGATGALRTAQHSCEMRIAEAASTHAVQLKDIEERQKRQVQDMQQLQNRQVTQLEFDLRAFLKASLAEREGKTNLELKQMEENNQMFRSQMRTAVEEAEVLFGERARQIREDMGQRLERSEESVNARIVRLGEDCEKRTGDLQVAVDELRKRTDTSVAEMRTSLEKDVQELYLKMTSLVVRTDRAHDELTKAMAAHEQSTKESIAEAEANWMQQVTEQLKVHKESIECEARQLVDGERAARLQAEAERLASLQRRLASHEELTTRKLEELRVRMEDHLTTQRQALEAQQTQSALALSERLEDGLREDKEAIDSLRSDMGVLVKRMDHEKQENQACRDEIAAEAAEGRKALQNAFEKEVQAIQERQDQGLQEVRTDLRAEQEAIRASLASDVAAVSNSLQEQGASMRTALDNAETRAADARAALKSEIESSIKDLQNSIDTAVKESIDRDAELGSRCDELQGVANGIREAMNQRCDELQSTIDDLDAAARDHVDAVQDKLDKATEELKTNDNELAERLLDLDDKLRGLENTLMEKQAALEETVANEVEAQRQELTSELESKQQDLLNEITTRKQEQEASFEEFQKQFAELQATAALESAMRRAESELAERRQSKAIEALSEELRSKIGEMAETQGEMKMRDEELQSDIDSLRGSVETDFNSAKDALEQQAQTMNGMKESLLAEMKEGLDSTKAEQQKLSEELKESLDKVQREMKDALDNTKSEEEKVNDQMKESLAQAQAELQKVQDEIKDSLAQLQTEQQKVNDEMQNKMTEIVDAEKAEKEKLQEEEKQREAAMKAQLEDGDKQFKEQLAALQAQVDELTSRLQQAHEDQVAKAEEAQKALEAQKAEQTAREEEAQKAYEALQALQEEAKKTVEDALKAQQDELKAVQENLEKQGGDATKAEETAKEKADQLEALQAELTAVREQLAVLQSESDKQQTSVQLISDWQDEYAHNQEANSKATEELKGQQEDTSGKFDVIFKRIGDLQGELDRLAELGSRLDSVEGSSQEGASRAAEDLAQLREQLAIVQVAQGELKGAQAESQEAASEIRVMVDSVPELKDQLKSVQKEQEQMSQEIVAASDAVKAEQEAREKAVTALDNKVDGGFQALVLRVETERYFQETVDGVADLMMQTGLQHLARNVDDLRNSPT
eukprot:gnl/MRDRNA2_/MRDRNA2_58730_c0_seq1.p1 gnl/MRDRNA2_/MRDRNA2_58730_c0~~gnl/MRDRNA2_/MRDRNA2_58730_c0_seq1.p1  ORF type:complete len:1706 (+),score=583.27 gnl/MRDRNA2_/MRDRNA2_58730_c0_seq1:393-5120(+)